MTDLKKLAGLLLPVLEATADVTGFGAQFDAAERLARSVADLVRGSGVDLDDPDLPLADKLAALDAKIAAMNDAVDSASAKLRGG